MTQTTPRKHLVLYADDDADDISMVESAFSAASSHVELVAAYDGEDVLEFLKNLTALDPDPCLIILDINMPRLDGRETLQRIRQMERYKKVPVVLFTTSSLKRDRDFAEQFDAGFVTKPLTAIQLEQITDQFIEHCTEDVKRDLRTRLS
jgi:CheY-like chemotaxis protein